jgi:hypothetical protein
MDRQMSMTLAALMVWCIEMGTRSASQIVDVLLSQRPNESRLLPFITGLFGKPDSVADGQAVRPALGDAVAMKVNLAFIGRIDETVVSIWKERLDHAVSATLWALTCPCRLCTTSSS